MSGIDLTATRLTPVGGDGGTGDCGPGRRDLLVVGAGLGTGVSALWGECAAALAGRFDVVGWDLPGHGLSAPRDEPTSVADLARAVADLVRDLRATGEVPDGARVGYAGVSLGGAVALRLALDHGDLLDGVAVICSAPRIGEPAQWRERAAFVAASGTPSQVEGSARRWFAPGFIERHPERATRLLHTLQETDRHSYARMCEALAEHDLRERLGEITVPVLAVHGELDQVCPPADGEGIAAAVPGARAVVVDGVAHQAPAEDPAGVAHLLAEQLLP